MEKTIFLAGARGSGKSTVGQLLADLLGYVCVDTDIAIQQRYQQSITAIVEMHGWERFRAYESIALREAALPQTVVCTGGGIVLSAENRALMRKTGTVVYLEVPAEVLAMRLSLTKDDGSRPSLTGRGMVEEVKTVLTNRSDLYRDTAHLVVDGAGSPEDVARQILRAFS